MANIFYADYFVPKLVKIEGRITKNPEDLVWGKRKYDSPKEFYKELRHIFNIDRIAVFEKESSLNIVSSLISKFLKKTGIDPQKVSYIINTDNPKSLSKEKVDISEYIVKKYKFINASTFLVNQGCGASGLAIGIAAGLVSQKGGYAIILSYNIYASGENRLMSHCIMGDGIGIMVISKEPSEYEIVSFDSRSLFQGSYYNHVGEEKKGLSIYQNLHFLGYKFFEDFFAKNELNAKDIYAVIPQNVSKLVYTQFYAKGLKIPKNRFFLQNIRDGGHMGNVDIIRNFKDFTSTSSIPNGANILTFGIGIHYSTLDSTSHTVLLRYKKK